ncbi:MAG TPA: glycine betaine ABC transporter substrate-binding protein, partial [Streptosporangiaceae bacterium]|nr:glycine betaine ABC transporter substrate-binding protein [Streptosporangiaceae bacterium]
IAKTMIIGGPPEFKTRSDGLVGLKKNYGLTFKNFTALDESGPITLAALKDGKVQAADVFTTTPQIITDKLVSLADPKFNFAAQNVVPLVYKAGVNPTVIKVLNEISAKLNTVGLLAIDKAVILDKDPYTAVAQGWLSHVGIKS